LAWAEEEEDGDASSFDVAIVKKKIIEKWKVGLGCEIRAMREDDQTKRPLKDSEKGRPMCISNMNDAIGYSHDGRKHNGDKDRIQTESRNQVVDLDGFRKRPDFTDGRMTAFTILVGCDS
jgi:hypothetical protein